MSKADRHSEALLGIHLAKNRGRPQGSPPSDEELALMIDGLLSEERRLEILSHLASRPERYRQWLSLADMDADEQESQAGLLSILTKGINNWLIDWRYAAGGVGAMAAVLLLVNQMAVPPMEELERADTSADSYALAPEKDGLRPQRLSEELARAPASGSASESGSVSDSSAISENSSVSGIGKAEPSPLAQAKPDVDALAGQQFADRTMAEESSHSSQRLMAAKKSQSSLAPPHCISISNPATTQDGLLCAVGIDNERYELRWTAAGKFESLPLIELNAKPLAIRASEDQRWLAVQSIEAIDVYRLENAFKAEISRTQLPFAAETARIRWEKNELLISVMQALGDSDDDLLYRYQPETGEIQPTPP